MTKPGIFSALVLLTGMLSAASCAEQKEYIPDPSFERLKTPDQFGQVFADWDGWKYEGDCEFRVGKIAHSGEYSCLLYGVSQPKIRVFRKHKSLEPGRYRVTAYFRGLDIGEGMLGQSVEFAFNGKYFPSDKNGTFGWTKLTYVGEVKKKADVAGPSVGLMAPGYLWVDDMTMVKVGDDVPLTPQPIVGEEEQPVAMPEKLGDQVVRCPECSYRNDPRWRSCYACGTELDVGNPAKDLPPQKLLASFEESSSFGNGTVVQQHATHGTKAWRLQKGYSSWSGAQDWSGYDFLKADLYVESDEPMELYVEIRDKMTTSYWTRVNYSTAIPPGSSTLVLPIGQLYVGEKSRPGRKLQLNAVTRLVVSIGDEAAAPLYIDNVRLERDLKTSQMLFDGLHAFDLGSGSSPLMPGFRRLSPASLYSPGRGFGLKDAKVWRVCDVLQPDPLYQDFICLEQGGVAIDVPNGRYHVFVNLDNPSGYWGEYQKYRQRAVVAEGRLFVKEGMDFHSLKERYFRFWDCEDLPDDNTFDNYQKPYYDEKEFDVDVADGQLNLEFRGSDWACSVSAIIVYPLSQQQRGQAFVDFVRQQRRFHFDNYFKRVLHTATGDTVKPSAAERDRGYLLFTRDYMEDVYYNDTPRDHEVDRVVEGFSFAGEYEPLTLSVYPLRDLGQVSVTVSNLRSPSGAVINSSCVDIGYVMYRLSRVTMEGSVYTIEPRLVLPSHVADVPRGVTRRFWLTVRVPPDAPPGEYEGAATINPDNGLAAALPIKFRVYRGSLDEVDIPVGPWGHSIEIPWYDEDPATQAWNEEMTRKSLRRLREYGFTSFSGMPLVEARVSDSGEPQLDFSRADRQMRLAREQGFCMPIVNYCPFKGFNMYQRDERAMRSCGFTDYSEFVKMVFTAVQGHAEANDWLPVYWNLGDEPLGDGLVKAVQNAKAYRKAFPTGPPFFTAATSFVSADTNNGHFALGKEVHVANLNGHNAASIKMLQEAGSDWAFYNGGNRWTCGVYMYKAAKEFNMVFRLSWHWNITAGDPYYALDCREDDYAWCNASPDGRLVPSVHFEREMREGLDDYRYMLTLARLSAESGSREAASLVENRLSSFELGQRDHDAIFPAADWREFRQKMAEAIEELRR